MKKKLIETLEYLGGTAYEWGFVVEVLGAAEKIANGIQVEEHRNISFADAVERAIMSTCSLEEGTDRLLGILKQIVTLDAERIADFFKREEALNRESGAWHL